MKFLVFVNFGPPAVWIPLTFTLTVAQWWFSDFGFLMLVSLQYWAVSGMDMSNTCWKKTQESRDERKKERDQWRWEGGRELWGNKGRKGDMRRMETIHWLIHKMCHYVCCIDDPILFIFQYWFFIFHVLLFYIDIIVIQCLWWNLSLLFHIFQSRLHSWLRIHGFSNALIS